EGLGGQINLRLAINSGPVRIGDGQDLEKSNYQDLWDVVNSASHAKEASQHFRTRIVTTEATHALVTPEFRERSLGSILGVGSIRSLTLHELAELSIGEREWQDRKAGYEQALEHFVNREFGQTARTLASVRVQYRHDDTCVVLMAHAIRRMLTGA